METPRSRGNQQKKKGSAVTVSMYIYSSIQVASAGPGHQLHWRKRFQTLAFLLVAR